MIPSSRPESDSEQELVRKAQLGDPDAIDTLFSSHMPSVRAFVRLKLPSHLRVRESCSDLVQSTCRDLLSHLEQFEYRGRTSFRNWFYTAALNKIREKDRFHRAAKRDARREKGGSSEIGQLDARGAKDVLRGYTVFTSPENNLEALEAVERIETAFDQLSEADREVILLTRMLGLSAEEAGEQMKRTALAVRSLLSRALVKLARNLEQGPESSE